jgi:Redoxin
VAAIGSTNPTDCGKSWCYGGKNLILLSKVFGLSTQTAEYQREMAERLHLPFEIMSDSAFQLCDALRLPTFVVAGTRLLKRLTMVVRGGRIEHVLYIRYFRRTKAPIKCCNGSEIIQSGIDSAALFCQNEPKISKPLCAVGRWRFESWLFRNISCRRSRARWRTFRFAITSFCFAAS